MSEKKVTRENISKAANATNNSIRDNALRTVDEIARVQPQIAHSITNLQQDTLEASKNIIRTTFDAQKQIALGLSTAVSSNISEQAAKYSKELADDFARAGAVYNQFVIDSLNATQESVRIFGRTIDAIAEWNANILSAWTSF